MRPGKTAEASAEPAGKRLALGLTITLVPRHAHTPWQVTGQVHAAQAYAGQARRSRSPQIAKPHSPLIFTPRAYDRNASRI